MYAVVASLVWDFLGGHGVNRLRREAYDYEESDENVFLKTAQ